jgi:hypothetical protein
VWLVGTILSPHIILYASLYTLLQGIIILYRIVYTHTLKRKSSASGRAEIVRGNLDWKAPQATQVTP